MPGPDDELPAAERVAAQLRSEVTAGLIGPGDRLKDLELSARCGVSRATAREALRLLAAEGLITVRLHSGATVRHLSVDDIRDIYRVRRTLECAAILGSAFAPDAAYAAIDRAVVDAERHAAADRWGDAGTASLRFHEAVVALSGSPALSRFFAQQLAQLRIAFWAFDIAADFQAAWIPRDREIADLLLARRRDEAERAMRRYLDDAEAMVVDAERATHRRSLSEPSRPRRRSA